MIFLKINTKQIKLAMTKHVLDILTILPRDKILFKGIFYVRDIIDAECKNVEDVNKWDFSGIIALKGIGCQTKHLLKHGISATKQKKGATE